MELRTVDPRSLQANPHNPRRTGASEQADAQLVASIRTIGLVQPPLVQTTAGKRGAEQLTIIAGHRRVAAAITAGLDGITVLVQSEADASADPMKSISENLVRADMGPVDRWRAMEALAGAGWTDEAVAGALNVSTRNIAQLRLLAHICGPMLDRMAQGDMPNERELRTIAAAGPEEQTAVWKKNKPKRTENTAWYAIAQALTKNRYRAVDAKFGPDEAAAFGIVWEEDLFAPADEDSRTTTQTDAFLEAQQAWLEANLPKNGAILAADEYGRPNLPRGAHQHYGKAGRGDVTGFYLYPRTGKIETVVYTPAGKTSAGKDAAGPEASEVSARPRPDVTQKGAAMIGDLRTDALQQALREKPIDDDRLIGLLVLALGSNNVDVRTGVTGAVYGSGGVRRVAETLIEGAALTADSAAIRAAAREALVQVLSCRENHSASGMKARHAGAAIGADAFLPTMATEAFLPCLSRAALEREAGAEGVRVETRAKDTRAAMLARFKDATWIYPGARFAPTAEELEARRNPARLVRVPGRAEEVEEDDFEEVGEDAEALAGVGDADVIEDDRFDDDAGDIDRLAAA